MVLVVAIANSIPAFEAPGKERRCARRVFRQFTRKSVRVLSVAVDDGDVYAFLQFVLSECGRQLSPWYFKRLVIALAKLLPSTVTLSTVSAWSSSRVGVFDLLLPFTDGDDSNDATSTVLALISFRPSPILPLTMDSARRAVTFVHGYIALVTANAYISTLGGGHFLCLHLHQAKVMARLQIAIADALHDPVLKSKCRVNLAYNAMREGRFHRAQRLIKEEEVVAQQLENDELAKICVAAQVYLVKTIRLHQEFQRKRNELTVKDRALVDNFYRQRIVRQSK